MMKEAVLLRRVNMQLTNQGFPQKIVDKYNKLRLFTLNFSPAVFTKRIIPFLSRWIELMYAMPYLISRREILTSLKESRTNIVTQPIKQIWNILVHLEGTASPSQYGQQPLSYLESRPPTHPERSTRLSFVGSRPPASVERSTNLSQRRFDAFKPQNMTALGQKTTSLSERAPLILQNSDIAHYPYELPESEAHKGGKRIGLDTEPSSVKLPQAVREQPEGERKVENIQKELPVTDHQPSLISYQPPSLSYQPSLISYQLLTLSYKPSAISQPSEETYTLPATKDPGATFFTLSQKTRADSEEKVMYSKSPLSYTDFISDKQGHRTSSAAGPHSPWGGVLPLKNEAFQRSQLNVLELGKVEPIYHTYPRIEPVTSKEAPQIIREERIIEKEVASKSPQLPKIDVDHLADQVYQLMERKIRIERERRGL